MFIFNKGEVPQIRLTKPDDAHLHVRDGQYLRTTVSDAAARFARAVIMPNLKPPITTVAQVEDYRRRILANVPAELSFQPLMTLYLTDNMAESVIYEAQAAGTVVGCKLYPAGVTTHSAAGITKIDKIYPLLAAMEAVDLPLLVHGESNDPAVDIFDREKYFLEDLARIILRFPQLRIVLEHITTQDAVEFVTVTPTQIAATITVHHLLLNRNDLLAGGIHPHYYCLPILKRHTHQLALIEAAISGNPKFFLGTDSAPHAQQLKENACGCAGIYSAHAAIELYAQVFEEAGALDKLEGFASCFAADFYQLPRNIDTIVLEKQPWQVPKTLVFGDEKLVPLMASETITWRIIPVPALKC